MIETSWAGPGPGPAARRESAALAALILFQAICAIFFAVDVVQDVGELGWRSLFDPHLLPELAATLGLVSGIAALWVVMTRLLRRQAHLVRGLDLAQGALNEVIEGHFRDWGLTGAERDVAMFTIKGCSIADIARLRGSAEATVKTHLNAIYRKSGMAGRGQLTSLLIEELMGPPLLARGTEPPPD